jgi:hypothetical protein
VRQRKINRIAVFELFFVLFLSYISGRIGISCNINNGLFSQVDPDDSFVFLFLHKITNHFLDASTCGLCNAIDGITRHISKIEGEFIKGSTAASQRTKKKRRRCVGREGESLQRGLKRKKGKEKEK